MYNKTISSVNFWSFKIQDIGKIIRKKLISFVSVYFETLSYCFQKKNLTTNQQPLFWIYRHFPFKFSLSLKILSFKYTRSQSSLHWFAWFRHLEFLIRLSQSIFVLRLSNFHLNLVFQDAAQKNSQIKKRRIRGWRKRFFKFWGQRIQ